jgi:hypothetical protein
MKYWSHSSEFLAEDKLDHFFKGANLGTIYRYEPHNDVSVNDGPHIRRWSHKIII